MFNLALCELTSTFNPKTRSVWGPTLVSPHLDYFTLPKTSSAKSFSPLEAKLFSKGVICRITMFFLVLFQKLWKIYFQIETGPFKICNVHWLNKMIKFPKLTEPSSTNYINRTLKVLSKADIFCQSLCVSTTKYCQLLLN